MKKLPSLKLPTYLIIISVFISFNIINKVYAEDFKQIIQFINPSSEIPVAVINAGKKDGVNLGTLFKTYRIIYKNNNNVAHTPLFIETGLIKVIQTDDTHSLAQVIYDETEISKASLKKFSKIMAGDIIKEANFTITKRKELLPTITLYYKDLFLDPNNTPSTLELSEKGKLKLKEALEIFLNKRISKLIIEGHTDLNQDNQAAQIESYQRALTIKQFMINELAFSEDSLIAVGFGDQEPQYSNFIPEDNILNRRIVIKAANAY